MEEPGEGRRSEVLNKTFLLSESESRKFCFQKVKAESKSFI